ncbi:tRNA pseudouridine32 synthase / 23S rRNA pseudouridine746 synthase [Reichenbachiella faecimaris]|uniref:tRNA pseudouridine32 synthase / 23S rRNA pseudouridine746 synthase n=1 Tax=Reichenbachiella faecimaris TaxID=692418 RepID=A0A1W2G7L8_REIFA|nr:RluA family pseudouridine synthase [Reichenbachiella faecimaris]SMD32494.1 tRNA pseudouridine32 synthase / 23S rRNA pseudouridine746 synthase [Reichenbachiella faecimaris]
MNEATKKEAQLFTNFHQDIDDFSLPKKFTYPFFYEPHPLCQLAAKQLQKHLSEQTNWQHDFGIDHWVDGVNVGKMFGVLLVQNQEEEIGFLSAFSGKLADAHHLPGFVPPVVDYLAVDSFFRKGEKEIEQVNSELDALQKAEAYLRAKSDWEQAKSQAELELSHAKKVQKEAKKERKTRREEAKISMPDSAYEQLDAKLKQESMQMHYQSKDLVRKWNTELAEKEAAFEIWNERAKALKSKRRQMSNDLQQQIFDEYQFLNIKGETRGLCDIFAETAFKVPPSGAGDCALPKLLQYAFRNQLKPLAMAEFWWGQSPKSEVRKHGYFYPSCKGKCEPILGHMLEGMEVEQSPMLSVCTNDKELKTVYEDEYLLVINKPHEFLSVPGKTNADSVLNRMEDAYPNATGPLLVHRLDRATSGLLLVAKTKEVHKDLQDQFLDRTIKKRYVALLEGLIKEEEGTIELPLRPDIEDRPRQLVCFEHGKPAATKWKVVKRYANHTLVHLWPLTGRTHQLRVHAAHQDGLNTPMVGDDLYGKPDIRLHLQAAELSFIHPVAKREMTFVLESEF